MSGGGIDSKKNAGGYVFPSMDRFIVGRKEEGEFFYLFIAPFPSHLLRQHRGGGNGAVTPLELSRATTLFKLVCYFFLLILFEGEKVAEA